MTAADLAKILDDLGQRLGPTGQHVFELAVRQVYITNGIYLISALAVVTAFALTVRFAAAHRDAFSDSYGVTGAGVLAAVGLGIFGIVTLLALVAVPIAVAALLNPEYAALSDLIGKVTGSR